jgi:hypothetical protein
MLVVAVLLLQQFRFTLFYLYNTLTQYTLKDLFRI